MTATDELRAMLDERGVEWETDRSGFRVMWGKPVDEFHDTMQFKAVDNALPNGGLNVHICGFTPEQAIAATLGAGTCEDLGGTDANGRDVFNCSGCGCVLSLYDIDGSNNICTSFIFDYPRFCPECGARVVRP